MVPGALRKDFATSMPGGWDAFSVYLFGAGVVTKSRKGRRLESLTARNRNGQNVRLQRHMLIVCPQSDRRCHSLRSGWHYCGRLRGAQAVRRTKQIAESELPRKLTIASFVSWRDSVFGATKTDEATIPTKFELSIFESDRNAELFLDLSYLKLFVCRRIQFRDSLSTSSREQCKALMPSCADTFGACACVCMIV